jgi:hypothetical protein
MDRNHKNYAKDVDFSYRPFMDLLGNGIITSQGAKWERARRLLSGAFRIDILEETAVFLCGDILFISYFSLWPSARRTG